MQRELCEEKETTCASLHAETTQQANGQERVNVDYARMHHVFSRAIHLKTRPRSLQGALTRVAFHLVRGPRKGLKVRNPSVGGIPGALSSTSSTSGRIRTPRQRAAVLHSGLRISVAQRVQLVALLAQVISAEDIDARQVSAADSTDCLIALCDLRAALGAPFAPFALAT